MDREAAEKISKWAGNNTVRSRSRSRARFLPWLTPHKATESDSETARPLVLPQEIQRLDNRKLLVRRGNLHLYKLDRVRWFDDPWFMHLGWSADPTHKPLGPPLRVEVVREDVAAIRAKRAAAVERAVEAERQQAEEQERAAEAERDAALWRLEALRTAHREATTAANDAAAETLDAAAKAAKAEEMARTARQKAKDGGDGAEGADVAEAAAKAATAKETARQAKQRASAAARDAKAAARRLDAFARTVELPIPCSA